MSDVDKIKINYMTELVQLKFSKIKYSGDSIGDNIRVEIEILDKFLSVNKIIKTDMTKDIDQEIGRFITDKKSFEAEIKITVIEKDLLFNDVGNIESDIKIDTSAIKPQQFIYEIQIKETHSILGKIWGNRIANFEIVLEATIGNVELCIPDTKDGWLITFDMNLKEVSLPAYLKVKSEYIKNKREYFIPLEGVYRGQLLSIKLQDDGSSYLISGIKHESMVRATYSISKKIFTLNGKKYTTVDYEDSPWKKGLYDIEIPDHPHPGGRNYTKIAPHSKVWFRIGHFGDKYIHAGSYSLGCITIIEHNKWEEIYFALIKARKGDFDSVGALEIID